MGLKQASDLFHIENTKANITIQQLNFYNGVIKNQVLNIIVAENLTILDSNCSISNSTNEDRKIIYSSIGGCFRTQNIFFRKFVNVKIFDSFSDKTTFGIKILDDLTVLTKLKPVYFVPKV